MPSLQGIWEPVGIGRGHFCSILVLRVMMSIEWKAVRRQPKRRGAAEWHFGIHSVGSLIS